MKVNEVMKEVFPVVFDNILCNKFYIYSKQKSYDNLRKK